MRRTIYLMSILSILILTGCKVSPRSKLEISIMTCAKRWIFIGNKEQKNPLPSNPETIAEGKEAFSHYCIVCHGLDGQKTGVPFADHISPPIPSLASPDVQRYTDGQLKQVIDYGIWPSGMPASKGILNDEEIWSIVVFLRHLPPAGSLGEPQVYSSN